MMPLVVEHILWLIISGIGSMMATHSLMHVDAATSGGGYVILKVFLLLV
jgi:hypothetical protein